VAGRVAEDIASMGPWFVVYKQVWSDGHEIMAEEVIRDQHPVDWLVELRTRFPNSQFHLVFFSLISLEVYERHKDNL